MEAVSLSIARDGVGYRARLEIDGTAAEEKVATTISLLLIWSVGELIALRSGCPPFAGSCYAAPAKRS